MIKEHEIKDIVYVVTDVDQSERLVTGILIEPNNIQYRVRLEGDEGWFYGFELSKEIDTLKKVK